MRTLFVLMLLAAPVAAAPAPFGRPTPEYDPVVAVEQLKRFMLREHAAYADGVDVGERRNEWVVKANVPTASDGQLRYLRVYYRVTLSGADRRGKPLFTAEVMGFQGRAVTR